MTFKIASALALLVVVQAVPLVSRCVGSACHQAASSGNVDVGSTTNIAPVTNVTPITNYQPIFHANAPIVSSDCYHHGIYGGLDYGGLGGGGLYGNRIARFSRYGYGLGLLKRDAIDDARDTMEESLAMYQPTSQGQQSNLLFSQFQTQPPASCAPTDTACVANLPQQTVDLGSSVSAVLQTNVMPSTTYQSQVQSLDSNIQAAPAQQSSLSEQSVNMGHNTFIQPTTQVLPQTSYQPTVNQLTTDIQAAPVQDQSLPQSSVQLGSSVNISPSVTVHPSTTFQPSIQSLPFIINSAPCVDSSAFAGASSGSMIAPIACGFQGDCQGDLQGGFQGSASGFQGSSFAQLSVGMDQAPAQTLPVPTGSACTCA
ncbi:hypothetical protein BGZ93_009180 [Podila epicladia]|nr:hypothetical protein BGZ92_004745 [Podila epicladia]KAG0099098.1 hypothetical protein BGZ93_009180 [Podila epicladia]